MCGLAESGNTAKEPGTVFINDLKQTYLRPFVNKVPEPNSFANVYNNDARWEGGVTKYNRKHLPILQMQRPHV